MSLDAIGPAGQAGLPPLADPGSAMVAVVAGDALVWTDHGFADRTGLGAGSAVSELLAAVAPWARDGLARRLDGADGPVWAGRVGGRRADGLPWAADIAGTPAPAPASGEVVLAGVRVGGPVGWGPAAPTEAPLGLDSMLSHDVRGALRHAAGFAGVVGRSMTGAAESGELPDGLAAAPERLEIATRAVATADEMVEAAVRYLRVLAEPWAMEAVDVGQLVARAAATARSRLAGVVPDVHVDAGDDAVLIAAPDRLGDAVAEVIVNACRFGGPEVGVTVTAGHVEEGWVRVEVVDDGPGVAAELAEDAFVPGRMLQPRGRFPGVGMGLAIVRAVVVRHGGRAAITPAAAAAHTDAGPVGRGTVVVLDLPAQPRHGDR
ncbi:MAG: sensor histidine kinase [Acidimicrobiales bacterium]